jgi:hypothetical protein
MKRGYVKLYRKVLDSAVWGDQTLFHLFIFCLIKANHKTSYASIDGVNTPIKVEPGQFITGRDSFHSEYYSRQRRSAQKFSPWTLRKKLKVLEDMQILSIKTCNKYSIVSIVKWNTYQNVISENEHQNEQQLSTNQATTEQQLSTSKELIKNEENSLKSANAEEGQEKATSGSLSADNYALPPGEGENQRKQLRKRAIEKGTW